MKTFNESIFFEPLLDKYAHSPSIVLCRVPELELFSQLDLQQPVLDHCCGDGFIAATAFPGRQLAAGIDISKKRLRVAERSQIYGQVLWADASVSLPFPNHTFHTIVNNSGIEHIENLHGTIAEIFRVLRPGGRVCLSVLNRRFFEWWPLAKEQAEAYCRFQPFYHAMDEKQWRAIFMDHGFAEVRFIDYLPEPASRMFAILDYKYSSFYLRQEFSLALALERLMPPSVLKRRWRRMLADLIWEAPAGTGGGFLIEASKSEG